jgi:hypothetical protein
MITRRPNFIVPTTLANLSICSLHFMSLHHTTLPSPHLMFSRNFMCILKLMDITQPVHRTSKKSKHTLEYKHGRHK